MLRKTFLAALLPLDFYVVQFCVGGTEALRESNWLRSPPGDQGSKIREKSAVAWTHSTPVTIGSIQSLVNNSQCAVAHEIGRPALLGGAKFSKVQMSVCL